MASSNTFEVILVGDSASTLASAGKLAAGGVKCIIVSLNGTSSPPYFVASKSGLELVGVPVIERGLKDRNKIRSFVERELGFTRISAKDLSAVKSGDKTAFSFRDSSPFLVVDVKRLKKFLFSSAESYGAKKLAAEHVLFDVSQNPIKVEIRDSNGADQSFSGERLLLDPGNRA